MTASMSTYRNTQSMPRAGGTTPLRYIDSNRRPRRLPYLCMYSRARISSFVTPQNSPVQTASLSVSRQAGRSERESRRKRNVGMSSALSPWYTKPSTTRSARFRIWSGRRSASRRSPAQPSKRGVATAGPNPAMLWRTSHASRTRRPSEIGRGFEYATSAPHFERRDAQFKPDGTINRVVREARRAPVSGASARQPTRQHSRPPVVN